MFHESMSPKEAYRWLRDMDKTFASLEYSNLERVRFFAHQLHERAHDWWRMVMIERDLSLSIT